MDAKMRQLLSIFADRFVNRQDAFYRQWADAASGRYGYKAIYGTLTLDLVYPHICTFLTLGLPNLDANGCGKWICFDSDVDDGALDKLETWLKQRNWHVLREAKRPGRSGHLWILFSESLPGNTLRTLAQVILQKAGLANAKLEVFPKQPVPGKLGSQVRMPLGVNRRPSANGSIGWFEGPEKDVQSQLIWLSQQSLNDSKLAAKVAHDHRAMPTPIDLKRHDHNQDVDRHEVAALLKVIDPNLPYDDWIRIGIFVHANGLDFELWDSWSAGGIEYDEDLCEQKWKTFDKPGSDEKRLTIATLHYYSRQYPNLKNSESRLEAGTICSAKQ